MKFKVGDKVRVAKSYKNTYGKEVNYTGGTGVIHKVREGFGTTYVIRFDNPDIQRMHDFTSNYAEHELEILPSFKVGDKVKVIKGVAAHKEVYMNCIGVITLISDDRSHQYYVSFDGNNVFGWVLFTADELKLIESPAKERPKATVHDLDCHIESRIHPVKVIYVGYKTILLYKDFPHDKKVRRVIAKCHPDDEYNRQLGLNIAVKRAHTGKLERELKALVNNKKQI